MTEDINSRTAELAGMTVDIVSAFVSHNSLPVSGLPDIIASVHASLSSLGDHAVLAAELLVPAVNPKRSVFPDYIICLEDGKRFKSLKRHIGADFGLTPDAYRARWGLSGDYPMVAPNYAAARSALAKASGLGRKPGPLKTPAMRKAKAA